MPNRAPQLSGSGRAFFKLTRHLLYTALLALILSATASHASADVGPPDLAVMQALQTTYGWGAALGWPENTNPCPTSGSANWDGVTCNRDGRVVVIVAGCGATLINQPIPPIVAQLTALTSLDIVNCGLTGEIPAALTTMTSLTRLRLDDNVLTGTIPTAFAALSSLSYFTLENNQFTGAIPLFPNLNSIIIRLGGNFLTQIPAAWTSFNRGVAYNCYPSLPPSCDSQSGTNECTPNRQDCPSTAILSKVSGDGQRTQINTAFVNPLVVSVTDFSSNPIAGITVTFSGPGVSTVTAITDGNGNASANVAANSVVGGNTVTASVDPNTMVAFGLTAGAAPTCGADFMVTSNAESGPGTLMEALADVCPGGTVDLSGIAGQTIALCSGAPSYNFGGRLYIATDVTLQGGGVTISGSGATRIFFVQNGNVTLNNLTLADGLGQGGTSELGGSAGGLGGAIFENNGNLTLNGVVLSGNQAVGGSPDNSGNGAGGGFGVNSTGGDLGGAVGTSAGAGGIVQAVGGIGGFGGGGGAGTGDGFTTSGGEGGFGGGGGGAAAVNGGGSSGIAGYGGGQGAATSSAGRSGGGGAGFGGAIFVNSGALNLNNVAFTGNSAVGGTGAQGKGGSLFLYNSASFNMVPNSVTFSGDVAAAAGASGQGYASNPYNNGATCPGVDTVDICGIVPTNTLTVSVAGNGAVADSTGLINCHSRNCSALFQNSAVLTPAPAEGYVFSGWSGGGCSGLGACTVSLAGGSASVTATFAPGTIQLANGNSPNLGSTAVCFSAQTTGCGTVTALTFNVDESVTLAAPAVVTQGASGLDFNLAPNGFNCTNGQCTVQVNFTPLAPGLRLGAIQFSDTNNHVLSTSYISGVGSAPLITFAPAVSQTLPFTGVDHPLSLAVDAAGDVFVGDYDNRVLELPAGGGPLTTLPVTGIGRAFSVAVDGAGDVFIADYYNQQVVEVPARGGVQVTLPLTGLQGPSGVAVDGAGDVFVSDIGNQVFEVPAGGGAPMVIGSGWNNPRGLAVDGAGDLFVADSGSGNLLEVQPGNSQTVTVASGFNGPVGIAVDAAGDVFVADTGNNRVVEVPVGGCPAAGCPTVGAGFSGPWGVAVDGAGNVFVADTVDSQVAEVLRPQAPTLTFQSAPFAGVSNDSPQSVTVQNTGNANLVISGLSIGLNFTQMLLNGTPPDCTGSSSLASGASCNLSISFTPAAIGPLTASATLTDNSFGGNPAVQTITLSGTGTQAATGAGVASSGNPSAFGQPVYFTASVTPGTATGTVQFQIDGVNFGAPAALSGGQAISGTTSTLAVGGHAIAAIYSGDTGYTASTGSLQQTVNDASASVAVALTTGLNPSTYGAPLTFTATVSGQYGQVMPHSQGPHPRDVTGSLTWTANTGCGSTAVTAGTATCTTSVLPGGSDTVTASYGGDGSHAGNTGSLGQTVNLQTPAVTVTNVNPSSEGYGAGTPTMITATLTWTGAGAAPTAGLTFKSTAAGTFAGSPSCSATASTITCTQSLTPTATDAASAYTISASYAGNGNYNPASSTQANNFSITQTKITPTVTMTSVFPNAEPYGASVGTAIIATLSWPGSGPAPTAGKGTLLSFSSNASGSFEPVVCLGRSSPMVCGTLFRPVANDVAGVYTVAASYAGDSNYNAASSPQTNNFTITADTPAVRVTPNPVVVAHASTAPVTLTVAFTGAGSSDAAPTGTVTFSAATGSFSGQSCSSSGDVLKCTVSYKPSGTLAPGTYTNYLRASISADADYKAASGYASLTVTK
jgi:hypothetical protein